MSESVLVKDQKKQFEEFYTERGLRHRIRANVRWDDQCGNGHNTFAITGDIDIADGKFWREHSGGCIHDDIAKRFPDLAPYIKWHLCDSDGPMYYIQNTLYHCLQHGPNRAWVYYIGAKATDPLGIGDDGVSERLLGYVEEDVARKAEGQVGYRVEWDKKTEKIRNLDHARSCAVWPEATDEQLSLPPEELTKLLEARLPALMAEFQKDVGSLGFVW